MPGLRIERDAPRGPDDVDVDPLLSEYDEATRRLNEMAREMERLTRRYRWRVRLTRRCGDEATSS
jgi:hypothetical protein